MDLEAQIKELLKKYSDIYNKGVANLEILSRNGEPTLAQGSMNRAWKMIVNDLQSITDKLEHDTKEK